MLQTPETNVQMAALRLLKYKMIKEIEKTKDKNYEPSISVEELNDILLVGGVSVVRPEDVNAKELDVIQIKEDKE